MSGDQPSGKAPERTGIGVHFMYFVYAGVAVLCYVFGWVVLAVFLCLMTLAWLFAYFDDKKQGSTERGNPTVPDRSHSAVSGNSLIDLNGKCPVCSGKLFVVEVGVTTKTQIMAFAQNAKGWQENPQALAGHMPPGIYCRKGCCAIHTTPAPVQADPIKVEGPFGFPVPERIKWADIMRDGGSYALVYDSANNESVKVLLKVIGTDKLRRTGYRNPQLAILDPLTLEPQKTQELDWDEAAGLGKLLTPLLCSEYEIEFGGTSRASEMIRYLSRRGKL
ncbi:MAG: hypothetical protein KDI30_09120 [Pseudomonadales bacterium]|nr:hypothetical protein [Pseudomonadales bacterium]